MRIANQWKDYRILDTSGQEKLEQWGNVTLIRPDPQIIWKTPKESCRRALSPLECWRRQLGFFPEAAGIMEHSIYTAGFEISDSADQL